MTMGCLAVSQRVWNAVHPPTRCAMQVPLPVSAARRVCRATRLRPWWMTLSSQMTVKARTVLPWLGSLPLTPRRDALTPWIRVLPDAWSTSSGWAIGNGLCVFSSRPPEWPTLTRSTSGRP